MADKTPIREVLEVLAGTTEPSIAQIDTHYPVANRICQALIEAGHLPLPDCADCGVTAGQPHTPGCDVARCKLCGWQDVGDHASCPDDRPSTIWTGRWPGELEVEEYGLADLNELESLTRAGFLCWDRDDERWFRSAAPSGRVG